MKRDPVLFIFLFNQRRDCQGNFLTTNVGIKEKWKIESKSWRLVKVKDIEITEFSYILKERTKYTSNLEENWTCILSI